MIKTMLEHRIHAGRVVLGMVLALLLAISARTWAQGVQATPLMYRVAVPGEIESVKDSLVSTLEGKNYTIINTLNVQQGLKTRGIQTGPILLVEFINLTEAFKITKSNEGFEMFAPLRAALFQKGNTVTILILRPRFIESSLGGRKLSREARTVLERFDLDMYQVLKNIAAGGF